MIQISFRTPDPNITTGTIRNPRQNSQLIHDPLCFQNLWICSIYRKNPQSVPFLRPNPSIRKPNVFTPSGRNVLIVLPRHLIRFLRLLIVSLSFVESFLLLDFRHIFFSGKVAESWIAFITTSTKVCERFIAYFTSFLDDRLKHPMFLNLVDYYLGLLLRCVIFRFTVFEENVIKIIEALTRWNIEGQIRRLTDLKAKSVNPSIRWSISTCPCTLKYS